MRKVAIFDIDGTIFRSSLLIELVEVFIERGIFPPLVRAEYEKEKVRWLDRKGDYGAYIVAVVNVFMKHIKGVHYDEFTIAAKIVVDRYHNRTYRFTEELIRNLKKKNYYLLAVSQSPKGILDLFCNEFGFDKVYGMFYELGPTDRFTGRIEDEHIISNKAAVVRRAIAKEMLTLAGSVGVGDTESDIAFLELVERPICFNPNMKLWKHAKRNDWEVFVERKDVIYEIGGQRKRASMGVEAHD
jgi:HAD superfamily phosphoserine phosphatase-like hydrolase